MMSKLCYILLVPFLLFCIGACNDEDTFSSSPTNMLSFQKDSIKFDTLFTNVPSSAKSFWIYNKTKKGIRCTNIRLNRGNQTGFRVNIDGTYLGKNTGYQTNNVEVRSGDSIRIYVEVTAKKNNTDTPQLITDKLIFTLESGKIQKIPLQVYSWDALFLKNLHVSKDTTIGTNKPIVVKNTIVVDTTATLTIKAGTRLYFDHQAGIDVYGSLKLQGTADKNIILRGSRLDKIFDYLPYDRLSGQWQGIHFYSSSANNYLKYTDIHSAYNGITIDSTNTKQQSVILEAATIHNCQGYGIYTTNAKVNAINTIFSNTLNDCVFINGGEVTLTACTLAQFYPFDAKHGVALRFSAKQYPLILLQCTNTLITGYANNQVIRSNKKNSKQLKFNFQSCLLRTPKETSADSVNFTNNIYENIKDTLVAGAKNFQKIDNDSLQYHFELNKKSLAIGKGKYIKSLLYDRKGIKRKPTTDIGAYEYIKP